MWDNVDVMGLVLYSLFLLLVCWRVRPFLVGHESLSSTDCIKLGFHICLLGSALLELGERREIYICIISRSNDVVRCCFVRAAPNTLVC